MEPRLPELMKNDPRMKTLMDHALRLEGLGAPRFDPRGRRRAFQSAAGRSSAAVRR